MLKVLVAVKRVIDYQVKVRVRADRSGVETHNVKMSMNPFDEIAVEEAVRLKEQGHASETVVVTIGPIAAQETLRQALAMGVDRAIHIVTEDALEPLAIATVLHAICQHHEISLALLGKQAIDDDSNQTGQMLAALLGWPQATFASKLELALPHLRVTCEVDGGLQTVQLTLPAVVTTDLRLNQPRFVSLPNLMKAKTKPVQTLPLTELGLSLPKTCETLHVEPPAKRETGIKMNSINEILQTLHQQGEL